MPSMNFFHMPKIKNSMVKYLWKCLFVLLFSNSFGHSIALGQTQEERNVIYKHALSLPRNEAIAQLSSLVKTAPDFLEARYALGFYLHQNKAYKAYLPHFIYLFRHKNEVAANPSFSAQITTAKLIPLITEAYLQIANDYIAAQKPDSALANLKLAMAYSPDDAAIYSTLGMVYYKSGDLEKAVSNYLKALKRDPNNVAVWVNIGTAYWHKNEYENAARAYDKALKLDPGNASARDNLNKAQSKILALETIRRADIAYKAGRYRTALKILGNVKKSEHNTEEIDRAVKKARNGLTYERALNAKKNGELRDARDYFKKLPHDYLDVSSQLTKLQLLIEKEEQKNAAWSNYDRALAFFRKGEYSKADLAVEQLLQANRNFPGAKKLETQIDSALTNQYAGSRQVKGTAPDEAGKDAKPVDLAQEIERQPAGQDGGTPAVVKPERRSGRADTTRAALAKYFSERYYPYYGAAALLLLLGLVSIRRAKRKRRRTRTKKVPVSRQNVRQPSMNSSGMMSVPAAIEKIDFDKLDDVKLNNSAPGTQEIFEQLIPESPKLEVFDVSDQNGKERPEPEPEPESKKNTSNAKNDVQLPMNSDDEDVFLSLIDDGEPDVDADYPSSQSDDFSESGSLTHTVDMAQFQPHKIGRYLIEKEIGRGAAGRIYKAWDPKLDRTVVIKTVSYSLTATGEDIKRLKARVYREARSAARLNHPNIVVVYDVEDEATFSYIVMEYIEGRNLSELLDVEKKLDPERTIRIITQVCKALQFAHAAGIVHRDIKPSNILIPKDDKIKVTDFGIAKLTNHLTLTQTGKVVGTPSYMAPEQIEAGNIDTRCDLFSLGVVFYELLTGIRPFTGNSLAALAYKIVHTNPAQPSAHIAELTGDFDNIILKLMSKDADHRYQSASEVIDAMRKMKTKTPSN